MRDGELGRTLTLANEFKEGDLQVGGGDDPLLRAEAREALASFTLGEIAAATLVEDGVSEMLARARDPVLAEEIAGLTVAEVKGLLLEPAGPAWVVRYREGLSSETVAAVVKVMTEDELSRVARSLFNPLPGGASSSRGAAAARVGAPRRAGAPSDPIVLGSPGHFGSRIQPNSPGDDEEEILFSVLEGLAYGCGDVILGINPASDDLDTICRLETLLHEIVTRLELPTRTCVLSDLVKQDAARGRAPVDVGFQSLAGTSRALRGMVGLDADEVLELARGFRGLYFETGQGAEVTNGAAEGVDMVTLESRTYGLARAIQRQAGEGSAGPPGSPRRPAAPGWTIVNDVAGFIGPEVFRTGEQLVRACLEDTVMAKLHGLTMGLDVCSTFHMGISPEELEGLTKEIVARAAPAYLMAVAGNADPMLGYLTTSFRQHPRLRRATGRQATTAMRRRLRELGVQDEEAGERPDGAPPGMGSRREAGAAAGAERVAALYAAFRKAGGDRGSAAELRAHARRRLGELQRRGWDLGLGHGPGHADPPASAERLRRLYRHARQALYARLDEAVLRDVSRRALRVRTPAADREEYLARPASGERIRDADAARVARLYATKVPAVQLVLSDGLNADALNQNLRAFLPPLRAHLSQAGVHLGEADVVIENGRVRAGYHVGALLDVEAVIHLIGERPGTGLDTLSAYLTYGRDPSGRSRWSPELDHSFTTAVCGIHARGKRPEVAAEEVARVVARMLAERRSGVGRAANKVGTRG